LLWGVALVVLAARPASAQMFEAIGIRAQGMAGAFVAVADDSTATWWNPAGLASGSYFSGVVERSYAPRSQEDATLGVSFAIPSLGLSYYRLRMSEIGPTGPASADRQAGDTAVERPTVVLNQVGATFGQSVGEHLVIASTFKLVRADAIKGDVDVGAMVKFGAARVGLVVKHLHQPDVLANGVRLEAFDRQVRIGAAYVPVPAALTVNAALDADLTTTPTAFGSARRLAGGGEVWIRRRLGVRGGISVNTIDELRQSLSAGASVAFQMGLFIDGHITRGDDQATEGWGVDLRVTF
jgi:hypothetical protein